MELERRLISAKRMCITGLKKTNPKNDCIICSPYEHKLILCVTAKIPCRLKEKTHKMSLSVKKEYIDTNSSALTEFLLNIFQKMFAF